MTRKQSLPKATPWMGLLLVTQQQRRANKERHANSRSR